jgi:hypothetical protein
MSKSQRRICNRDLLSCLLGSMDDCFLFTILMLLVFCLGIDRAKSHEETSDHTPAISSFNMTSATFYPKKTFRCAGALGEDSMNYTVKTVKTIWTRFMKLLKERRRKMLYITRLASPVTKEG